MPVNFRSRAGNAGAYTLIELIMVMAVLALAAAILVPQLSTRDSLAVQAAVRMLIGDLNFAQHDAFAAQEHRRVYFSTEQNWYGIIRVPVGWNTPAEDVLLDDPDLYFVADPLTARQYMRNLALEERWEGVRVSAVDIDGKTEVTYDELGGTVSVENVGSNGGFIEVSWVGNQEVYRINVAPYTGKLTVQKCPCGP